MGQLGANLGPTWGQLGANMGPTWGLLGANLGQLGALWGQPRPAWANTSQRGLIWGQLEATMDGEIIEKPLFFLGFSNILKKSLEAFWNALGDPLGTPWGALGDALGRPGGRLGKHWGSLGRPGARLGKPFFEDLPWKTLGKPRKTSQKSRPPRHSRNPLAQFPDRCMYVCMY